MNLEGNLRSFFHDLAPYQQEGKAEIKPQYKTPQELRLAGSTESYDPATWYTVVAVHEDPRIVFSVNDTRTRRHFTSIDIVASCIDPTKHYYSRLEQLDTNTGQTLKDPSIWEEREDISGHKRKVENRALTVAFYLFCEEKGEQFELHPREDGWIAKRIAKEKLKRQLLLLNNGEINVISSPVFTHKESA